MEATECLTWEVQGRTQQKLRCAQGTDVFCLVKAVFTQMHVCKCIPKLQDLYGQSLIGGTHWNHEKADNSMIKARIVPHPFEVSLRSPNTANCCCGKSIEIHSFHSAFEVLRIFTNYSSINTRVCTLSNSITVRLLLIQLRWKACHANKPLLQQKFLV